MSETGCTDVLSVELLLNTVVFEALPFGAGAGVGAGSGSECAACRSGARAASSEVGGSTCAPSAVRLITEGSSRNFT
jgi:hypothetical protein